MRAARGTANHKLPTRQDGVNTSYSQYIDARDERKGSKSPKCQVMILVP